MPKEKPKYSRCGSCDCFHPIDFFGDCRDDANRFAPDQLNERHGPNGWIEEDSYDDPENKPDDRDGSPVEFSESAKGRDALDRWAQNYDERDGAPENDSDR